MKFRTEFKPHYDLEKFKTSKFAVTKTVERTALDLGFRISGIRQVVSTMKPEHFYKSMTSYFDNKTWQDVYHVPYDDMIIYIKFTEDVISEFMLLSFKEK